MRQEHVLAERDGDVAAADRRRQRPLEDQEEADPEAGSVFEGLVPQMQTNFDSNIPTVGN